MIGEIPDDKRTALYVEEEKILEDNARSSCITRSLLTTWWNDAAWPGMGLFGESYILFSIGLMKPFWTFLYPECFAYQVCSPRLLGSLTYSVVLGVITGMILLGYSANLIGRRIGGITTASFMCAGAIGLALVSFIFTDNPNLLFGSTSILLFVFGVGVGGEYPMSSSTATEKAMGEMKQNLKNQLQREAARKSVAKASTPRGDPHYTRHLDVSGPMRRLGEASRKATRGRAVQLVFMSQGIGILVNCLSLVFLLLLFGQYGSNVEAGNYTPDALLAIWRIVYSFGAFVLTAVLVSRLMYLNESSVWADDKERRERLDRAQHGTVTSKSNELHPPQCSLTESEASEPSAHSVGDASSATEYMPIAAVCDDVSASPTELLLRYFGWRIIGSSMAWFFWDVAFYGNKLFQTTFLLALAGEDTSLLQLCGAAALNAFVALLGYIGAAFLLDHPQVGRLRLQQYGFSSRVPSLLHVAFCMTN
ncbi:sugar transporter [Fragilaria crotonensis]|nr:sugar transporter [Fragilaria crotonensis]